MSRRIRSVIAMAAAVAVSTGLGCSPARAATGTEQTTTLAGTTWIINGYSGKCLGISGGNMKNGTAALQWDCGAADHNWLSIPDDGYYHELRQANSPSKCLGVPSGSKVKSVGMVIWDCIGVTDQRWKKAAVGYGYYRYTNLNSGMSMGVSNSSTKNGAPIIQWPSIDVDDQYWAG
ncbi:RICIN domain-containing protein [Plantactinospora siamensis]|uniref:RICIN domain-containing protein n=1 Tax=Plantactinospora siamensis TaxID=555372 RepID=A0ABV6P0W1_9ACTN